MEKSAYFINYSTNIIMIEREQGDYYGISKRPHPQTQLTAKALSKALQFVSSYDCRLFLRTSRELNYIMWHYIPLLLSLIKNAHSIKI